MDSPYFDAHTHVHFPIYDGDRDAVMERARQANVAMITVGTQADTSRAAVAFAQKYPNVWAAVGLHPSHTSASYHDEKELSALQAAGMKVADGEVFDAELYIKLAQDPKVVAIGECGLDYFRLGEESKLKQKEALFAQIDVSRVVGKPLMIHCRDAFGDLINILDSVKANLLPGVIHFFTGTQDDAKKLLDIGFSFTFGGVVTFTDAYAEVVKYVPSENILSETDAPYVAPTPHRGKRNEPAFVVETVKKLAELKGVSVEDMRDQIYKNVQRIFKIDALQT